MKTYISLFSSAGVGCYGFKLEEFQCIATNELIERRLEVQKFNNKCKYDSGYICGDITLDSTKDLIYKEIEKWKKNEHIKNVDVVIATPPCQGMSVANHKKKINEIVRNSLVVESIKMIKTIHPTFFVFENVPAFMKTICTDIDGQDKTISEAIEFNLGMDYIFSSKVINFKNYGACSSRSRTIVIGVLKEKADDISPSELFPYLKKEKTLREVIGSLPSLNEMGQIDPNDIYHAFRNYPEYMREWIHDLKEGQSAFDNEDDTKKPHQIIEGKIVINKQKNADKYTRQVWNKVGPCVHTRNDQLASQNTIHPADDRVFSIRELMLMMTVPYSFKWTDVSFDYLNSMTLPQKKQFLKKEEIKIRQSLGEAVPTVIFQSIAHKISIVLNSQKLSLKQIKDIIEKFHLYDNGNLIEFVKSNPLCICNAELSKISEIANSKRTDNAAFYTSKSLITEMMNQIEVPEKETIYILEPSVGVGNFIPFILQKFEGKKIFLDVIDIDNTSLKVAKALMEKYFISDDVTINYIHDDFLTHKFDKKYDFIIGNPPFGKIHSDKLQLYLKEAINKSTQNISSFFLDKATKISENIFLVMPKFLLNTPDFLETRKYLKKYDIKCIIDFGENGFPGVLIETIAIYVNITTHSKKTLIISLTNKEKILQLQKYITDDKFPYWIIYRNVEFDNICRKLIFGKFNVFRDRQITNSILNSCASDNKLRILKARNILDNGEIINIENYDSYINLEIAKKLLVYTFLNAENVYLVPNMTYKPRMILKPKGVLVNGSIAILIPIDKNMILTQKQIQYFSSDEYRLFYQIARNYQTRSLNVDSCSVYFYGILREGSNND